MLLVDGSNLLHRALHVPQLYNIVNENGVRTGGIHGFFMSLNTMARKYILKRRIIVCWDKRSPSPSRYRCSIFPNYKRHLSNKETPADIKLAKEKAEFGEIYSFSRAVLHSSLLPLSGCVSVIFPQIEADDIISWICRNTSGDKTILSSDEDLLQLVNEETDWYRYTPKPEKHVTLDKFISDYCLEKKFYVKQYIYSKAMAGDGSDNINGVRGIGALSANKIAKILLENLEEGKKNLDPSIKKHKLVMDNMDLVNRNYKLINLYEVDQWTTDRIVKSLSIACNLELPDFPETLLDSKLQQYELNKVRSITSNILESNLRSNCLNKIKAAIRNEKKNNRS